LNEVTRTELIRTKKIGKLFDLSLSALIAPDERGPDYFVARIKQDRAMHLPRETNTSNFISLTRCSESTSNRKPASSPPIARVLLRPSQLRRCKGRVLLRARGDDSPPFIHDESAGSAGANIDTEKLDMPPAAPDERIRYSGSKFKFLSISPISGLETKFFPTSPNSFREQKLILGHLKQEDAVHR
jgi:hypothetical protein